MTQEDSGIWVPGVETRGASVEPPEIEHPGGSLHSTPGTPISACGNCGSYFESTLIAALRVGNRDPQSSRRGVVGLRVPHPAGNRSSRQRLRHR